MKKQTSVFLFKKPLALLCALMLFCTPLNTFAATNEKQFGEGMLDGGACILSSDASAEKLSYTDERGSLCENAVKWENGKITYSFELAEGGIYHPLVTWLPFETTGYAARFSFSVDDTEWSSAELSTLWKDNGDKRVDDYGNEIAPEQSVAREFDTQLFLDRSTIENLPYSFALSAGTHTLTLDEPEIIFVIAEIGFVKAENTESLSYADYQKQYAQVDDMAGGAEPIVLEAESAHRKTSRALVAKSDNSSAEVTPSEAVTQVLNYIGGDSWTDPGQEIIWKLRVEKSGFYQIGLNYKQSLNVNGYSYRDLKIDGQIPFSECKGLRFDYGIGWNFKLIGGEEPYLFYLEEGDHTLSLAVSLGEMTEAYQSLKEIVTDLGDMYIDISMITGESPDPNRDYDLFDQIANFTERMTVMYDGLMTIVNDLEAISSGSGTSLVSSLKNMARILDSMLKNPYTAQNYVSDYYSNYTTVSSWLYDMKSMPLSLDQIQLCPAASEPVRKDVNLLEGLLFSLKRFFASFVNNYSTNGASKDGDIKIWVNWGRDQTMVLSNLISEDFTTKTGINVNLEITNATLVKGIMSNNAPDLALHLARTEPVNLGMRGALYDLTQFEDYADVLKNFGASASTPYVYKDAVYALPDTQSFYLMFYRKDVLESLGVSVPETWEDFLSAAAVLQRNNMQVWIPYTQITSSTTVNTGVGGLNLFASILQQYGGSIYNETRDACSFNTETSLSAFTFWTDLYTKHKLPTTASFYNRFRIGTMPLGIESYTLYTTLTEAAPEIEGRWGIALIPGVRQTDGTIDHTVSGSGTGCSILSASGNKNAAWEFLKWWTSADVQLSYNNDVETILGAVSRITTANTEAFSRMSWQKDDLDILLQQREWIREIPEIPGSYYVTRAVDQAFWNVINSGKRPKDMLVQWGEVADNEITRKISEYEQ